MAKLPWLSRLKYSVASTCNAISLLAQSSPSSRSSETDEPKSIDAMRLITALIHASIQVGLENRIMILKEYVLPLVLSNK